MYKRQIPYTANKTSTYEGKNYVLEKVEKPSNGIITTTTKNNVVNVYYTLDADGPGNTPDNVPVSYTHLDVYKRQVQFLVIFLERRI